MAEDKLLTLTELEERMNDAAWMYATANYTVPRTAFRVFLWPSTDFNVKLVSGPTAKITMGILPNQPGFFQTLRSAIDLVVTKKMYSTMAVVKVAYVLEQDRLFKAWVKERYDFDWELIPGMIHDEELTIRMVERIEVIHKPTGLREVVEVEQGRNRSTFAARDIAKTRLSRRVWELKMKKDLPFPQPKSA